MTCERLKKALELPHNKDKEASCPMDQVCRRDFCLFVSDLDQLIIDQKDPEYFKRLDKTRPEFDKT